MKLLTEFKNIHKNKDIYILASGKSIDFIDSSFFKNKIVIGINQSFKKIKSQYLVRKENKLCLDVINNNQGSIIFISKGNKGGNNNFNEKTIKNMDPNKTKNICLFNHYINDNEEFTFPKQENYLVVSYSTITSGIHLAAYMGAKNIILVGHDCGTLNGKPNFDGYHSKTTYNFSHPKGSIDYIKWLKKIESQTIKLKHILHERYSCNIYSLNPFINFGLEGHKYQK